MSSQGKCCGHVCCDEPFEPLHEHAVAAEDCDACFAYDEKYMELVDAAASLQQELDELERTDPAVKAAAEAFDATVARLNRAARIRDEQGREAE